ncbi:MAG: enoyl-CoA hydratase/isomerase family protein, partial [Deltaproteobacteria bacterium]|nr:enoyl-CoA hydratase/isomerase family protein [Deltaproteobacteria bacterium]
METEDIQVEVKNRVCWITLNRPKKLNSLTIAMHDSIRSTLDDLDESVKCVVITGSGSRAFSAGADISEIDKLTPEEAENYSQEGHKTIMKILNYPKPVIAVIQGYALGGGLELALSCDFRLATENSRFGFPETKLGLIP